MTRTKEHWNLMRAGLTACFILCMQFVFCQSLQTITDRKDILIGEQIKLTIKLPQSLNTSGATNWLTIPDSIPHFDIVETGKASPTEQTLTITSFDSGRWVFPALPVAAAKDFNQLSTDSFYVNVSYAPADTSNQLRDIKPIINVYVPDYFWYFVIGGGVLLLLIIYLLYRYFTNRKKTMPSTPAVKLSPFDEAMLGLQHLAQLDLEDAASIKTYHVQLAEIFKNYLGRKQGKNLLNKTTGDLLISMKEVNLPAAHISALATALRSTDAVKFAKYLPLPNESEDSLQKIKTIIELTEQSAGSFGQTTSNKQ